MNRYRYMLAILFALSYSNNCAAQVADSTKMADSVMKCWRVISHEYATIYGLEEEEIKRYSKQKICLTRDSIRMYYGTSYMPKYSVKKVNAESYAKTNFDCSKDKLGISADSVFKVTISSVTRPLKNEAAHKMTDVIAFDGYCLYVVVDGVIFKLFDANAKVEARSSN
jgi:hypothetical protein